MKRSKSKIDFQQAIYGTWGRFQTPQGTVEFLETKARIGHSAKDREKRLTNFLRPVREVLPTSRMDFNQLLQRDLDDHRVATQLVKYVLDGARRSGPAFFPPLVAALLPFQGTEPQELFPDVVPLNREEDEVAHWAGRQYGTAFKFERMMDDALDEDSDIKLGRLSWNPEELKMVVIDGQHRAMALLAIDRTINGTWTEAGEKYKYFYEPVIERLLEGKTKEERESLFKDIEFPVTIVWFPDENRVGGDHQAAARKLFVDVNQNARAPSESRILLLSDTELVSIFTRRVLNEFRRRDDTLPIYAIEYDNPGRDQAANSKWSAISNVMIIRDCIRRTVFGPKRYIDDLGSSFGGRESDTERSLFMRTTLQIDEEIPEMIDGMNRSDISNENFPASKLEFLQNQFMRGWGTFVVRTLSELLPFQAHSRALIALRDGWATGGSTDTLAKDAVFEGVGMYWTIRDAHQHWFDENAVRAELKKDKVEKSDVVRTWDVIEQKGRDFAQTRARYYLGKEDAKAFPAVQGAFNVFNTNACQLGLSLAARTLAQVAAIRIDGMPAFTDAVIAALNASILGGPKTEYGRRTVFFRDHDDAFNRIVKLDTPFAMHFRYFWLELLCTAEAMPLMAPVVEEAKIVAARDDGRHYYYAFLVKDMERALKRTETSLSANELNERAREAVEDKLRRALLRWFGVRKQDFEAWLTSTRSPKAAAAAVGGDGKPETAEIEDQAAAAVEPVDVVDASPPSLNELLSMPDPED